MANNFNLSNYQYTNTKLVSCPGRNLRLVEGSVSWLSELANYVISSLPAGTAIHSGLVWRKMIVILWSSSMGVGGGPHLMKTLLSQNPGNREAMTKNCAFAP
jgi:hypothetical protein